ncbi:hypothetical protein ACET9Q_12865 [Aeromonas caviae]|uniref:Uncharacterized protein n=1 Tax=Aeromonas caviae TaxID=648 RepID=A0A6M4NPK9_AERCA|nr:hypothetical protein [Aeromonas caviae]MDH1221099.1 hypothetical protein [Aeromonas caviae]QJR99770.1 Hypothetical protein [Aeromonas caviae]QMV81553.1 Hypothetical protein [Aeromonas caviae]QQM77797.1 hypothetical protein JH254_20800 [Aeromonas caviae]QQV21650.1 hypothetical protein JJJ22_21070 [Aeromonas caviae]
MGDPILDNGHWFTDGLNLFIVPPGVEEIIGPDQPVLHELNAIYREGQFDQISPDSVAAKCGLEVIPSMLRRKFGQRYFSA